MIHTHRQTDVHQWRWWLRGLFITDKSGVERKSRVAAVVVVYKKKEDVKADARESEVKALPVRVKVNENSWWQLHQPTARANHKRINKLECASCIN